MFDFDSIALMQVLPLCAFLLPFMVLGAIDSFSGQVLTQQSMTWNPTKSTGVPNPGTFSGAFPRGSTTYGYGSSGVGNINQIFQYTLTVGAGATNNLTLHGTQTNAVGDLLATLTAIKEIKVELLNTSQGGGANATSISLGNAGANPWAGPFGTTGVYTLNSGDMWAHQDLSSAGKAVAATSVLKILNNDGSNAASVRITIFGFS